MVTTRTRLSAALVASTALIGIVAGCSSGGNDDVSESSATGASDVATSQVFPTTASNSATPSTTEPSVSTTATASVPTSSSTSVSIAPVPSTVADVGASDVHDLVAYLASDALNGREQSQHRVSDRTVVPDRPDFRVCRAASRCGRLSPAVRHGHEHRGHHSGWRPRRSVRDDRRALRPSRCRHLSAAGGRDVQRRSDLQRGHRQREPALPPR